MSRPPLDNRLLALLVCSGFFSAAALRADDPSSPSPGTLPEAAVSTADDSVESPWSRSEAILELAQAPSETRSASQASPAPRSVWVSNTKSTGGRPIQVARFGTGPQLVVIFGSIYGNEPRSIELMDEVAELARKAPPPEHLSLILVRTLNPDGVAELIRTNAHGVDLNRNFPTPWFTRAPTRLTGLRPASETETQFAVRLLKEANPVRVIHIHTANRDRPLVFVQRDWPDINDALPAGTSVGYLDGGLKEGSIADYVSNLPGVQMSEIQVPYDGASLTAANILRFASAKLPKPGENGNSPANESTPAYEPLANSFLNNAVAQEEPPAQPDGQLGNVDLLPPPPEFAGTSGSQLGDVTDAAPRFEELPPPPR